jgi:hypothetical protein
MSPHYYPQENAVKKIVTIILVCLAIAFAAYAGFWFIYSKNFKKEVAQLFTGGEGHYVLTHDGISCKGFPLNFEAVIKNPTLSKEAVSASTDGYWIVGSTVLGTKSWMEVSGKTIFLLNAGELSNVIMGGNLRLEADKPKKYLENLELLERLSTHDFPAALMGLLHGVSFSVEGFSIACNGDEPVFVFDQLNFDWKQAKESAPYSSARSLNFEIKGSEFNKNSLINLLPHIKKVKFLSDWACCGKSDLSLQALLQSSSNKVTGVGMPFRLDIEKLFAVNAYGTTDLNGMFEMSGIDQNGLSCTMVINCEGSTTKAYHDLQVSIYKDMAERMLESGELAKYPTVENLLTNHWDEVAALIPDYTTEKPVKSQFDLTFQIMRDSANKNIEDWNCDLRKCHIQTASHDYSLQGCAGLKAESKEPFFDFQVSNYKPIIQDLATYYNRWQSLLTSTGTFTAEEMPFVNAAVVNRITGFVESFSTKEKPDDLHLAIKGKGAAEMFLMTLTLEMQQLVVDVMPELYPAHSQIASE